ncbi:MAG: hypothetical protein Q4B10_07525 [Actinomycetaceae bacterium]|nr:hypothetical protein [Actinomycetaceae bacterium]
MSEGQLVCETLSHRDLADLAGLVETIENFDNPPFRTSARELERWLTGSGQQDSVGWRDGDGRLLAYGHVRLRLLATTVAICCGGVHPSHRGRGLGEASTSWQTQRARGLLAEAGVNEGRIITHVEAADDSFERHLINQGYTWATSYFEMTRPTRPAPEPVELDHSIAIVPWDPALDDEVRRALNRMSRDYGAAPLSHDQWLDTTSHLLTEASFLALDRSTDRSPVAGFVLTSIYSQDWQALGVRQGAIDMYGLDGAYTQANIVEALIVAAVRSFGELGLDSVGISAAAEDRAGRAMLARLGFEVASESREYVLDVTASRRGDA